MNKKIAQVVVGLPVEGPFDYLIEPRMLDLIKIGARVRVPFGSRRLVGFVVGLSSKSPYKKLKALGELIDEQPIIDADMLTLAREISLYYGSSWGEAIEASLPQLLRKGKSVDLSFSQKNIVKTNPAHETLLLHDQSQSDRWPYLTNRIQETLKNNQGVIFLVPEASMVQVAINHLGSSIHNEIAVWDKRLKASDEFKAWIRIKEGGAKIVLGTRSAIFAPIPNLGLIIVSDEENSAYKQEQVPHYHAREVAFMRAKIHSCSLILSSLTPSTETWQLVQKGQIQYLSFKNETLSDMQIINMLNYNFRKSSILSIPLQVTLEKTLKEGGRVILFMNRRGFSSLTRCPQCGYILKCERCDVALSYLYSKKKMVCRHCNFSRELPKVCPGCNSSYLRSSGSGIEKLESEVSRIFPQARVSHFDKDTQAIPPASNVIIATQAILKEKENILADIVAVLNLDAELNRMDFRSGEKVFSLLLHLRFLAKNKLLVQTRLPDNYCLQSARDLDFKKFYKDELKLRRELSLPPFKRLISVVVRGPKEDIALGHANELFIKLKEAKKPNDVEILEPQPDIIPKLRGNFRFTISIKGKSIKKIISFLQLVVKSLRKKVGIVVSVVIE